VFVPVKNFEPSAIKHLTLMGTFMSYEENIVANTVLDAFYGTT
jgi:hypothetical protein